MLFVLLRALSNMLFAQTLRLSQARGSRVLARSDSGGGRAPGPQTLGVITVNYLVATLASLVLAAFHRRASYLPPTVGLGVLGGMAYIVSILLFMPAMRRSGVSIAVAVLQLAILWPVAYAMLVFGEMPSPAQWVGMAAAVGALVLLSMGRALPRERKSPGTGPRPRRGRPAHEVGERFSPLLPLLFFVTGISGIATKAFHQYAPAQDLPGFMTVLFGTATLGGALAMVVRREPLRRADLALGAAAGLPNAAQLEFLLRAMETVPAIIVFPVSSALALVLNAVAAILWWGERLDRATSLGLALALAATVLLNRG